MILELKRVILTPYSTVGVLRVDGEHECFVCEDRYRPPPELKVPRKTAIPNGRYEVRITHSPRFNVDMPLLFDVPGFTGVRIHPGNTPDDTEGCLLPGKVATHDSVRDSRAAYSALFAKLRAASGKIVINVAVD